MKDTFTENYEHCKRIGQDIEGIINGNFYRCPECGEIIEWNNANYNEDEYTYTCSDEHTHTDTDQGSHAYSGTGYNAYSRVIIGRPGEP